MIDSWRTDPSQPFPEELSLCPRCRSNRIIITTVTRIEFEVTQDSRAGDPEVTAQTLGDSEWTPSSPARCASCTWHGSVADLPETVKPD